MMKIWTCTFCTPCANSHTNQDHQLVCECKKFLKQIIIKRQHIFCTSRNIFQLNTYKYLDFHTFFDEEPRLFLFDCMSTILMGIPSCLSYTHRIHISLYTTASVSCFFFRFLFLFCFFFYSGNDLDTWKHSQLRIFQIHCHFLFESLMLYPPYLI